MMAQPSVQDRLAIAELFHSYTASLDVGDAEGVAACFAADGWLDSPIVGRHQGREQLLAFAELTAEPVRRGARFRHVVTNLRIELDGNQGKARCYLLDIVTMNGSSELLSPGEYECELVKVDGRWLFQSRLVHMDRIFSIP